MSVMTGDIFADICEQIWGKDWKVLAAKRLDRSERQLLRIAKGESNVGCRLRDELMVVVREQRDALEAYVREYS